ncbi:MAG: 4-phosphopantetheinyl transferase family protein [Candidatus Electrothrix sp. AU1_5]|nr:4-phosphopantetheinyl transferase family protein [Candidatus Electrothrix gigas]
MRIVAIIPSPYYLTSIKHLYTLSMNMDIHFFFPIQQVYSNLPVRLCQKKEQALSLVDLHLIEQALQQDATSFLPQILSQAEQCYFQRFKYIKRKKEWLGGRIAGKAALLALADATAPNIPNVHNIMRNMTILPNKHGRPIIKELPACLSTQASQASDITISISISHSDGFATALARKKSATHPSCGVDIQEVSSKLAGLTSHFATDAELQLLSEQTDCAEDIRLTMLWTVKEALKKALLHDQSVIFSATELQEIVRISDSVWCFTCTVQRQVQSVLVHHLSPYVVSFTQESCHA